MQLTESVAVVLPCCGQESVAAGAVVITLAEAESAVFATLVDVTLQEDTIAGAVYNPVTPIVPQVADHVTEVFVLPLTVAVN